MKFPILHSPYMLMNLDQLVSVQEDNLSNEIDGGSSADCTLQLIVVIMLTTFRTRFIHHILLTCNNKTPTDTN